RAAFFCAALLIFAAAHAAAPPARRADKAVPQRPIDFVKDVQPLLTAYCIECHGQKKQKGDLRLDSRQHALRDAIVPATSGHSPLTQPTRSVGRARMPRKGPQLTAKQIAILRGWIDQGAAWPASAPAAKAHWAYRPLTRPPAPAVRDAGRVRNPIDA